LAKTAVEMSGSDMVAKVRYNEGGGEIDGLSIEMNQPPGEREREGGPLPEYQDLEMSGSDMVAKVRCDEGRGGGGGGGGELIRIRPT
jgi:hypothetical protein